MFKKILVPVDGSKGSQNALELAASIAKQFGSELLILHAGEIASYAPMPPDFVGWSAGIFDEMMDALHKQGNKILEDAKQYVLRKEIPNVKIRLEIGSPVATIREVAETEKVDLIVMGSRGLSDFKGLFLGSVSHGVLQRSHCPVLLAKDPIVDSIENKSSKAGTAIAGKD